MLWFVIFRLDGYVIWVYIAYYTIYLNVVNQALMRTLYMRTSMAKFKTDIW